MNTEANIWWIKRKRGSIWCKRVTRKIQHRHQENWVYVKSEVKGVTTLYNSLIDFFSLLDEYLIAIHDLQRCIKHNFIPQKISNNRARIFFLYFKFYRIPYTNLLKLNVYILCTKQVEFSFIHTYFKFHRM